ncbi:hypothetical protein M8J76_012812 [Diaphorina citri]|nr:hypothetical protein M8J76_012812 [Diaphorina citri]KAI5725448.1 hypothetical protein M8J77_015542 [Diaphorina citri]
MGLRAWRSHDPWLRILSAFQTLALVTCVEECNVTAELYKIDARLNAIARKVNTRTIDNFVFGNKLTLLQEKIGEYQDEDRRLIVQINGLPAIKPENLYRVIESLGQVLNISVRDEEITMLQSMCKASDNVLQTTGKRVYPILLELKTRKIKWRWLGGLRKYLLTHKAIYKKHGITITIPVDDTEYTFDGVTIHEHLSPTKRKLFKVVKQRCKDMDFQDMWFNDTQVYVKRRKNFAPFLVQNLEDMYEKITKPHWSRDRLRMFAYDRLRNSEEDH